MGPGDVSSNAQETVRLGEIERTHGRGDPAGFKRPRLLCNLKSLLTCPAQAQLDAGNARRQHPAPVNRAVAYHALKDQVLELLFGERPAGEVLQRLQQLFLGAPEPQRPGRKGPLRSVALTRSYQRCAAPRSARRRMA